MTRNDVETLPSTRLLAALGVCCAVGVGTIYFTQSLVAVVAEDLALSSGDASLVATAPQLGYAVGILLIVPLGDLVSPRRLVTVLLAATGAVSLLAALAPTLELLVIACFGMGCSAVVAPVVGPLAAGIFGSDRVGRVGGILLAASIAGMVTFRSGAAVLGNGAGWRPVFVVVALLAVSCGLFARRLLPQAALGSGRVSPAYLLAPLRLLRTQASLRRSCLYQACLFAGFTAAWSPLSLVLRDDFAAAGNVMGYLSLVPLVTMVVVPWVGRRTDVVGSDRVNSWAFGAALVAALLLAASTGPGSLFALAAGLLVLDVAMQSGMVANTARMYRVPEGGLSTMKTAYMVVAFAAGGIGSWTGANLYAHGGFGWVAGLVFLLAAAALAVHLTGFIRSSYARRCRAAATASIRESVGPG